MGNAWARGLNVLTGGVRDLTVNAKMILCIRTQAMNMQVTERKIKNRSSGRFIVASTKLQSIAFGPTDTCLRFIVPWCYLFDLSLAVPVWTTGVFLDLKL